MLIAPLKSKIPKDIEITFSKEDVIVSRTDVRGIITYCNKIFMSVSGYEERELLGKPHSLLRHPDMPKAVFKLLWDYVSSGQEIFAYVKNLCKTGEYYWVIAHITPSYNENGELIGYHSNRRMPNRGAVQTISEVYRNMLSIEKAAPTTKVGIEESLKYLHNLISENGNEYNEYFLKI